MVKTVAKAQKLPTRTKTISAFGKHGGERAKLKADQVFQQKKAASTTPSDWPDGWVVDTRWCSWLPADWTPAVKKTEGGLLIQGYVGPAPERKRYFHKVAIEKFLGRSLSLTERGPKTGEGTCGNHDPKMFIKRLEVTALVGYIKDRLNQLHGLSVTEAMSMKYWHAAEKKEKRYCTTDLTYDLKCKRLELVPDRPSQSSCPVIAPGTPAVHRASAPATPGSASASAPHTPGRRVAVSAPMTPAEQAFAPATPGPAPSTPATRRGSAAPSTPAKQSRKAAAPPTPSASRSNGGSSAAAVFQSCHAPLKHKAANGFEDEKSILAMQGVGYSLGLDSTMLKLLPEILRKVPAERGDLWNFILHQFEKAFANA